ncbi:Fc.00g010710.m01.CDS01 [Cosmosporella sp. VM-42]
MTESSTTVTATKADVAAGRPPYPMGIPIKFSPDGVVQRYPGNTTICHIPADATLLTGLRIVYAALGSHSTLSRFIRLLPPESWHMTILDGVCETECEPGMWPARLGKRPLEEWTKGFSQSLRKVGPELEMEGLAPPYRMRVRCFDHAVCGLGLDVEGATAEEEARMRSLRDKLADSLGFRAPDHETYGFHITLAYLLRHVDGEDRAELKKLFAELLPDVKMEFELSAVEFCTFENMCAYRRLFYLGNRREN